MIDKHKSTEQLFQEAFSDFRKKPSDKVWAGVNRSLRIKAILNLKLLLIFTGSLIVAVLILLSHNNLFDKQPANNHLENKQKITPNNVATINGTASNAILHTIDDEKQTTNSNNQSSANKSEPECIIINSESTSNGDDQRSNSNIQIRNIILHDSTLNTIMLPSASFTVSECEGCAPLTVSFTSASESQGNSQWDFGNGKNAKGANVYFTYKEAGEYTATHTVTHNGINKSRSVKITVHPSPNADFIIEHPEAVYTGDDTRFANLSSGAVLYRWDFGDGTHSHEQDPIHNYANKGIYDVNLKVISETGCTDSTAHKNLIVESIKYNIQFPTAFTPSIEGPVSGKYRPNDISNDIFRPVSSADVEQYKLTIYSKKGLIIFETTDFDTGWNGYYQNRLMPQGVYVYVCSGKFHDGEYFQKSGNITLLHSTR